MKRLYLLRHAESNHPQGVSDHDRPLNENGKRMCKNMNSYILENKIIPDVVLCSDALRTMSTAKAVFAGVNINITANKKLYNSTVGEILKEIAKVNDNIFSVMVIGHNPAIQQLAFMLGRPEDKLLLKDVKNEYPPCTLIGYEINVAKWAEVQPELGKLERLAN